MAWASLPAVVSTPKIPRVILGRLCQTPVTNPSVSSAQSVIRIFPRNEPANPAEYVSERPEMTSHGGRPRKAKTMKGNNNMKMILKNRTALVALLFVLALLLAPKVYASGHFATNYTNASLTGVYGYSTSGEILGPSNPHNNGTNIPVNNAGVMWF